MLLALPDEILTHVLSFCGCATLAAAACVCTRLRALHDFRLNQHVFSSAMEVNSDLESALNGALKRALNALPARCSFALILIANYKAGKRKDPLEVPTRRACKCMMVVVVGFSSQATRPSSHSLSHILFCALCRTWCRSCDHGCHAGHSSSLALARASWA